MKQQIMFFTKYGIAYVFSSLVCSCILTLFYIFKIIPINTMKIVVHLNSCIILFILCIHILHKAEKKAYICTLLFLMLYFFIALLCMPLFHNSIVYTGLKVFILSLLTLLYVLRK